MLSALLFLLLVAPARPILPADPGTVWQTTSSADGRLLAAGGRGEAILVWDTRKGRVIARFVGHNGDAACLGFNKDATLLASGGGDGTVRLWDVYSKEPLGVVTTVHGHGIDSVEFLDNDTLLACWDYAVYRIDIARRRSTRVLGKTQSEFAIRSAALSPDRRLLAASFLDGSRTEIRDARSLKALRSLPFEPDQLQWTPSGALAGEHNDEEIRFYDARSGKLQQTFDAKDPVHAFSVGANPSLLAVYTHDGVNAKLRVVP